MSESTNYKLCIHAVWAKIDAVISYVQICCLYSMFLRQMSFLMPQIL